MIRENKVIRGLGVTKDRQGLQDPQALLVQEAHLGTQGRMAPEECQEYPVNQGNQENKA